MFTSILDHVDEFHTVEDCRLHRILWGLHNKGWLRAIPFALLFIYCLSVYQFIPEMWDDYYFGSLCAWGYIEPDVIGTNFTFQQLFDFASHLYMTRLPRVLSLVILNAPLLRVQWLYRIVNSLAITLTFYGIYCFSRAEKTLFNAFATVILFGLFSQRMLTEGAFWFSAAMVTFVPSALMFSSLLLFIRLDEVPARRLKIYTLGCVLLTLFTSLMQEQISVTLSGTIVFVVFYRFIKTKRVSAPSFIVMLISCLGSALVCFGPGNLNRFNNEATATLSQRVAFDLDNFIATVFHKSNMPFLIVLLMFVCFLSYRFQEEQIIRVPYYAVCLWSIAMIPLSLYYSPATTLTLMDSQYTVRSIAMVVNCTLYLSYAGYLMYIQIKHFNDIFLTMFSLCGLLSVVSAFFYANYIAHRMEITLYLATYCVMVKTFSEVIHPNKKLAFSFVAAISCVWLLVFLRGYANNAPMLMNNREQLISTGARVQADEPAISPELDLSFDKYFTPEFVYPGEPGYPDLPWDVLSFKEFYGLPEDMDILYTYNE